MLAINETVAIIPARGGSKGLPGKNIVDICGRPLVVWSIRQALAANCIDSVWVSSDSNEILDVAACAGAEIIQRPHELSGDNATSESAWLHALDVIAKQGRTVGLVFGLQATSPIREPEDFDNAFKLFREKKLDSLFSSMKIEDHLIWSEGQDSDFLSETYDYRVRQRRQEMNQKYLENGSFYIFKPDNLRRLNNRLGGRIGTYAMEKYKSQQIDEVEDVKLCQVLMKGYGLDQ